MTIDLSVKLPSTILPESLKVLIEAVGVQTSHELAVQWDPKKAAANLAKHGVSFEEGLAVFSDPLARIFDDEEHSIEEEREIIIGHSTKHRLLLVCFTAREASIRILSVRKATRRERQDYEENVSS